MNPAVLVGPAACALLAAALLFDLTAELQARRGNPGVAHPGLAWFRAGALGLWIDVALRADAGSAMPGLGLALAAALAAIAPLHLLHVQGWKGGRARRAALAFGVLALGAALMAAGSVR